MLFRSRTLPSLREIFSSGEELKPELAARVCQLFPSVRLVNLYGPTECTIDVSFHEYVNGEDPVPIGRAVANTCLLVLPPEESFSTETSLLPEKSFPSEKMDLLPVDVPGELCVTGDLVGMGYLDRTGNLNNMGNLNSTGDLDENAGGFFIWNGAPAYRTGDFVLLSARGELLYLGRRDRQEKLRGMRIDTGAIENILMSGRNIRSAHVEIQNHCLTAYYEADTELTVPSAILAGKFPDYSIPRQWFWLPEFPRKENGKLDLVKLHQRTMGSGSDCGSDCGSDYESRGGSDNKPDAKKAATANTPLEEQLLSLIKTYFPAPIQADTDLIEEGLDSLTAIQIIQHIRSCGYECSYSLIFRYPSVALLAGALTKRQYPEQTQWTQEQLPVVLDHLLSRRERNLFLCVPYGGGNSEIFGSLARKLAGLPWDIACVSTEQLGTKTVEEAAEDLLPALDRYDQIVLTGYCVGSALATELARRLSSAGKTVPHVFLISSLPVSWLYVGKKKFSLWDFLSDRQISRVLNRLYPGLPEVAGISNKPGDDLFSDRIPQFRLDAARFFSYMEHYRQKDLGIGAPVTLFFGGKDPLSFHYEKKYQNWRHFYRSELSVISFPKAGHYLLTEHADEVGEVICRCLRQ